MYNVHYGTEIDSKSNRNVGNAKADRIAANMLLPWILVTWIIIIFNIVAGVIFGLEIEFPMKVSQFDEAKFLFNNESIKYH